MNPGTRSTVIIVSIVALLFMIFILLKPKISIGSGASNLMNPFGGNGGVDPNNLPPLITTPGPVIVNQPINYSPDPNENGMMQNGPDKDSNMQYQ